MSGVIFTALLLAAAIVWLWRRLVPPADASAFRVVMKAGRIVKAEGRIPPAMLSAFADVAAHAGADGEIRLTRRAELEFSGLDAGVQQRFRNAYIAAIHIH